MVLSWVVIVVALIAGFLLGAVDNGLSKLVGSVVI